MVVVVIVTVDPSGLSLVIMTVVDDVTSPSSSDVDKYVVEVGTTTVEEDVDVDSDVVIAEDRYRHIIKMFRLTYSANTEVLSHAYLHSCIYTQIEPIGHDLHGGQIDSIILSY